MGLFLTCPQTTCLSSLYHQKFGKKHLAEKIWQKTFGRKHLAEKIWQKRFGRKDLAEKIWQERFDRKDLAASCDLLTGHSRLQLFQYRINMTYLQPTLYLFRRKGNCQSLPIQMPGLLTCQSQIPAFTKWLELPNAIPYSNSTIYVNNLTNTHT